MDFRKYLAVEAKKIDGEVEKLLSDWLKQVKKISPKLLPLAVKFADVCFGGKRIRGVLVKLGYEIVNQSSEKEIYKIGAAIEILHTAILVHDDIIDRSPTRRDKPSLYKSVGKSRALTLGDLGFFLGLKIISESKFPEKEKNKALKLLLRVLVDTAFGQIMDIEKADPITTARLKTAHYTIFGPLSLGALLAGAGANIIKVFEEFGENLGIAFQIKDDILDGESGSMAQATKYVSLAKKLIPKVTTDKKMAKILFQLAEYLVQRSK